MDPRAKHEKEHEDSKKEREIHNNQSLYQESQDFQPDINSIKAIKHRN
jgi:hypothetical protein